MLETDQELKDFRILSIDVIDAGEGKEPGYLTAERYWLEQVLPGTRIAVTIDLSETIPNTGFCYDGSEFSPTDPSIYHYITVSGMDGSLVLTPFRDF